MAPPARTMWDKLSNVESESRARRGAEARISADRGGDPLQAAPRSYYRARRSELPRGSYRST